MTTCSPCTKLLNYNTRNSDDQASYFGPVWSFDKNCLHNINPLAQSLFERIDANHRYTYSTVEVSSSAVSYRCFLCIE